MIFLESFRRFYTFTAALTFWLGLAPSSRVRVVTRTIPYWFLPASTLFAGVRIAAIIAAFLVATTSVARSSLVDVACSYLDISIAAWITPVFVPFPRTVTIPAAIDATSIRAESEDVPFAAIRFTALPIAPSNT